MYLTCNVADDITDIVKAAPSLLTYYFDWVREVNSCFVYRYCARCYLMWFQHAISFYKRALCALGIIDLTLFSELLLPLWRCA